MATETYFLSSLDSTRFSITRACVFQKRLRFQTGKECVLVTVSPPVIGQEFGLGVDCDSFVIATRHEGEGLSPIKRFPCFVYITRPLIDGIEARDEIRKEDVAIIAWGELYRTKVDADQHVFDPDIK
jgi:hypothetical protein